MLQDRQALPGRAHHREVLTPGLFPTLSEIRPTPQLCASRGQAATWLLACILGEVAALPCLPVSPTHLSPCGHGGDLQQMSSLPHQSFPWRRKGTLSPHSDRTKLTSTIMRPRAGLFGRP